MSLATDVPSGSPLVGLLAYRFYLGTGDDGAWDQMAALELAPGGGFVPVLVDRSTGGRLEGSRYPGTASLAGRRITLTVPLADLGCPPVIRVRAVAEQTKGGVNVRDEAPDRADDWARVETGCPAP